MDPFNKTINMLIILISLLACTKSSNSKDKTILAAGLLFQQSRTANPNIGGPAATRVYGQEGNFSANVGSNGGITANSLSSPYYVVSDLKGGLYISDSGNHRVLYYPAGSTTSTRVYGQNGSFASNAANNGGITANTLCIPTGLAIDNNGGLYISDSGNSRVLYYQAGSTIATRVYGQSGSFTSNTQNKGGLSANSLQLIFGGGLALDSTGGLFISDYYNNRVLYFTSGSTTATKVYGRNGSFTTNSISTWYTASSDIIFRPTGVAVDSRDGLYIADNSNNRVIYYPAGEAIAKRVYGQDGSMTSRLASGLNGREISATTMSIPYSMSVDLNDGLYITDFGNNRILYFPSGATVSTQVYGQGGSMSSDTKNNGGISSRSLNQPIGMAVDPIGRLYIADTGNNRVLYY